MAALAALTAVVAAVLAILVSIIVTVLAALVAVMVTKSEANSSCERCCRSYVDGSCTRARSSGTRFSSAKSSIVKFALEVRLRISPLGERVRSAPSISSGTSCNPASIKSPIYREQGDL